MFDEFLSAELERIVSQMIRVGVVSELDLQDAAAPRVKCQSGETETDWIPWCGGRAGKTRKFSAPTVGEQVLILAPGGDPSQAVIIPGLFSDGYPAPAITEGKETALFTDGTKVEYDAESHVLSVVGADITVNSGNVTVNGGSVTVNGGDVVADGISLKSHRHMVIAIGQPTGIPQ